MSNGLRMTKTESMGKYNVGDIYSVRVEFEDDPTQAKIRPVVILYVEEAESPFVALVQPITSKPPDDPPKYHDGFKIEIQQWSAAGLRKPSWVKSDVILQVETKAFRRFIGHMEEEDLFRVLDVIQQG